ncbi:hypothetical protein [Nocardia aurantiaca]|uniref:hypothetical protein n=1 Tax=Nocardia aurantiaca TaxID=2675850 RepID=UPI0018A9AD77|nr:hypothetical protein [Nocardia aurantiaca]
MSRHPIPADTEMDVVRLIYAEGGEEARTGLTDAARTELYQKWTGDARIGGRLLPFLGTDDNIRVWIKNGPMKELSRALNGVGKYKDLVQNPASDVDVLVAKALRDGSWLVNSDSLKVKPLRVLIHQAHDEEHERWFTWAPVAHFKHLVWCALQEHAKGDTRPWVLCAVDSFGNRVSPETKTIHERIGERLDVVVAHVTDN